MARQMGTKHVFDGPCAEVRMLGGMQMSLGGTVFGDQENRSLKMWNVLAYLMINRNRSVPQSELIETFWDGEGSANPAGALKTLLHRLRSMLQERFGEDFQPIVSQRGSYGWSPDVACRIDAEVFEELCRKAQTAAPERKTELYRKAAALYQGDFLPKLGAHMWVVQRAARYHGMYIEAVKNFAALLEEKQLYEEMGEVCTRAGQLDPLDEEVHTLIIRALLLQGRNSAALEHYEKATDLLYRSLGVRPSEELRALYTRIMTVEQALETDLQVIQSDLRETAARPGAFYCEYGFFREAYRLEVRRAMRSGISVHIALMTLSLPGGGVPELGVLSETMQQLREVILGSLRRGDVVAKYSGAQYVIMLPAANLEDSEMVMQRVVNAFYKKHRKTLLKINVRIRALETM